MIQVRYRKGPLRYPQDTCRPVCAIVLHRSGIRRCWPESMEQSTSCCPLLCHIQHLQKRPQISPFWTIIRIVTIVYFDYVQRSCSSLYRLLCFINCPTYITLHYTVKLKLTLTLTLTAFAIAALCDSGL